MNAKVEQHNNELMEGLPARVAFTMIIVSVSMLFATLFLSYVVYRSKSPSWPPLGIEELPLIRVHISTALIVFSGLFFEVYKKNAGSTFTSNFKRIFLGTPLIAFLLGMGFMFSQISLWHQLKNMGLDVSSGLFSSLIHTFTWVHAAHIIVGLVLLWLPLLKGKKSTPLFLQQIGGFWHFLLLIWIVIYLGVFLF